MLHPDSFIFDSETFEQDIRAVLAQPGFKIFTAYRQPWWNAAREVTAGRSVTDLPCGSATIGIRPTARTGTPTPC